MFATEQCLLVLTHHPAVWHQAAQYLDQSSKLLTEKGVRTMILIDKNHNYDDDQQLMYCFTMLADIMRNKMHKNDYHLMIIVGMQSKKKNQKH